MSLVTRLFILLLPVLLTGCSYFSSPPIVGKDRAYQEARSIPPMRVPPGLNSDFFHATYPVSDRNYPNDQKVVNITPPGLMNPN